jgi:hypothetical protein
MISAGGDCWRHIGCGQPRRTMDAMTVVEGVGVKTVRP